MSSGAHIMPHVSAVLAIVSQISMVLPQIAPVLAEVTPILTEILPMFAHLSCSCLSALCERRLLNCRKHERQAAKRHPALPLHSSLPVEWVGATFEAY